MVNKMQEKDSKTITQQKSVSALEDLLKEDLLNKDMLQETSDTGIKNRSTRGIGISMQSFDSLMEHLEALDIRFLN